MYNTGFIHPGATAVRIKQGLTPQIITNACESNQQTQNDMYSAKQVKLDYGLPTIPDNCPCLDYIKNI